MIIDRSHRHWMLATLALTAIASISYAVYAARWPDGPGGGTIPGMIYGLLGSGLMLFAGLLSARKRVPTWRLGRAQTWLKGHIWLGILSVPLILFHSSFRWGGRLEQVLWWVFALIVLSGFFGLALQQFLPRLMLKLVSMETIYEQIPHVCAAIRGNADELVAAACGPLGVEEPASESEEKGKKRAKAAEPMEGSGPLKDFYIRQVRPFLDLHYSTAAPLASATHAAAMFQQVRIMLPQPLHESLDQLAVFCEERRQLALQSRLHAWLHGWLMIHIPLSCVLGVLGTAHAVVALWY